VVAAARQRWGRDLDGVLHLAGLHRERLLVDESRSGLLEQLRPKALGALVLDRLLDDHPGCRLVAFSSANGHLGGFAAGAYAAANAGLDAVARQRRAIGRPGACMAWTMWDEVGLARGYARKQLTRAGGYSLIAPDQGLHSLRAALARDRAYLLVGL